MKLESVIQQLESVLATLRAMQSEIPPSNEQPPLENTVMLTIVEQVDIDKGDEYLEESDSRWEKLCSWVIKSNADELAVSSFLKDKKLIITSHQETHLKYLRQYRAALFSKEMDSRVIGDQVGVTLQEKKAFDELEKGFIKK